MSEFVRYCGNESRGLHNFVSNHYAMNPVRNRRHGEPELLAACYRNSLALAAENHCRSIAFPCISTGVYGYPIEEATRIAIREVQTFLSAAKDAKNTEMEVVFCCFSERDKTVYDRIVRATGD